MLAWHYTPFFGLATSGFAGRVGVLVVVLFLVERRPLHFLFGCTRQLLSGFLGFCRISSSFRPVLPPFALLLQRPFLQPSSCLFSLFSSPHGVVPHQRHRRVAPL